jgi:triosephosphate isomerase
MERQKIAAGNWKMNKDFDGALETVRTISNAKRPENVLTIIGSPYPFLKSLTDMVMYVPGLEIAAQNCHHKESGAYTGEVSIDMLDSVGINYVIVGHSERREYFGESDALIGEKVKKLLDNGKIPIYCCGETLGIRKTGSHVEFVKSQISNSLFNLSVEEMQKVIIAYEPIWAIGTGETASPEQAQEMHAAIRMMIEDNFGAELASTIPILYGGSVKPANAKELFSQNDVDGGLVGGASLDAEGFLEIIHSF